MREPFPATPSGSLNVSKRRLAMMYFKTNVPTWERIIRAVMGLAVIGWAFFNGPSPLMAGLGQAAARGRSAGNAGTDAQNRKD
jgi:hypothetical protein